MVRFLRLFFGPNLILSAHGKHSLKANRFLSASTSFPVGNGEEEKDFVRPLG